MPKSNLAPSQVRKETDSAWGGEHVPGVIMLITDVLFLSGRRVQSEVFCGVLPGMSLKPRGVGPSSVLYERLGIPMPTAHPGICTQVCPLPKNVMSNSGIFPKSTGIPRTHDWQ